VQTASVAANALTSAAIAQADKALQNVAAAAVAKL
jgi:hypothetical protein